jgi:hypothetical protein
MNLICAKARTEFVSKEMKKDFKAGIKVSDGDFLIQMTVNRGHT